MNFFKKMFCYHEFELRGKRRILNESGSIAGHYLFFTCKKCLKKKQIKIRR